MEGLADPAADAQGVEENQAGGEQPAGDEAREDIAAGASHA